MLPQDWTHALQEARQFLQPPQALGMPVNVWRAGGRKLWPQTKKQPDKIVLHSPTTHPAKGHLVLRDVPPPSPPDSGDTRSVARRMKKALAKGRQHRYKDGSRRYRDQQAI